MQRPSQDATLSYFFGCSGLGKGVAVDVVAGDEQWFLDVAAKQDVRIEYVIDTMCTPTMCPAVGGWHPCLSARYALHESNRDVVDFDFAPLAHGQTLDVGNVKVRVLHTPGHSADSVCAWWSATCGAGRHHGLS